MSEKQTVPLIKINLVKKDGLYKLQAEQTDHMPMGLEGIYKKQITTDDIKEIFETFNQFFDLLDVIDENNKAKKEGVN